MVGLTALLSKLRGIFTKDGAVKIIVFIGLLGMLLILLSQLGSLGKDKKKEQPNPQTAQYTTEEYTAQMEDKLQKLIANIDGVGECQVMVTLEHGVEYVYAQEEKRSLDKTTNPTGGDISAKESVRQDTQSSYVLVDTEYGRKQALVKTQLQPKVQGVVIVCQGADNVRVETDLIHVVTTALNIPTTRVCVVKIENQS